MIKARIIAICSAGAIMGFACDPEAPDDEDRRGALPELVDDEDAELVPVTRAELAARGIEVVDADSIRTAEPDDGEPAGPAADLHAITDIDDPRLTPAMLEDMQLVADMHPQASVTVFTCPDNLQANVISFGGATAGWGSVGFTGGAVSSTSILPWFTGQTELKCHGDRTITPGYIEPMYVSRMSAVGASCTQGSGGGDFWFTCTVPDGNCCNTVHGAGCQVASVQACVCAADPYCCSVNWDWICVAEVSSLSCGNC